MILEYVLENMTTAEKIYVSRFLHNFLDVLDKRYLLKRSYLNE